MNLFSRPDYTDGGKILKLALEQGWRGDLYQCYLAYILMTDENVLSLYLEGRDLEPDSLWDLAYLELQRLIWELEQLPEQEETEIFRNFHSHVEPTILGQDVMDFARQLNMYSKPIGALRYLMSWYKDFGCGCFCQSSVFRLEGTKNELRLRVAEPVEVSFGDLIGYEEQKLELCANTEAFLRDGFCNNVLLYGDAGTGKSTSILALAAQYGEEGLKIIQVHKAQTELLPGLFDLLRHRNYHFILAMDDLSFEKDEREYKELKSALEGGVTALPRNVLVYATSNRRHLIKENWDDRNDMEHNGDVHRSETMEEKLSLSARFGLRIFYPAPTFKEYQNIISRLAADNPAAAALAPEELAKLAGRWQISAGSTSGRTARQFINSLL